MPTRGLVNVYKREIQNFSTNGTKLSNHNKVRNHAVKHMRDNGDRDWDETVCLYDQHEILYARGRRSCR